FEPRRVLAIDLYLSRAGITQLAECHLPKPTVSRPLTPEFGQAGCSENTSVCSTRPLTWTGPSGESTNRSSRPAAVVGPMTTSPGLASPCNRAARLVVSPI